MDKELNSISLMAVANHIVREISEKPDEIKAAIIAAYLEAEGERAMLLALKSNLAAT